MDLNRIINTNVESFYPLFSPDKIHQQFPGSVQSYDTVLKGRGTLFRILDRKDPRLFVIIGPCSIHDPKAALEYAEKLKALSNQIEDRLFVVMRVYFEKPRTTVGWKGLINDPLMDGSFQVEEGLRRARKLLMQITELGLPTATETLDPFTPQYLSDLVCWAAIGARTTESQTHREMASGLSTPVGFKNGTDGNIQVAMDAIQAAANPHHFLGIDTQGKVSVFKTKGNPYCHVVLRGGNQGPNYDPVSIQKTEELLAQARLPQRIVVDCSHGNSSKDHKKQPIVFESCIDQVAAGNRSIIGFMVESHLFEGNQPIPQDLSQLKYGISVTDKCIDWKTTEEMLWKAYHKLKSAPLP